MNKVFDIYLAKKDVPNSEAHAFLSLPARPYELQDALEKVRLKQDEHMYMEIEEYHGYEFLAPYLQKSCTIYELNHLAQQLGGIYVENGLVDQIDEIPNFLYEFLDMARIGKKYRQLEGGVFTAQGYVLKHGKIRSVYDDLVLTPEPPDHTVLLELSKVWFDDPQYDDSKTVELKLPADLKEMDNILNELGAADWSEVGYRCLDCKVPQLMDAIDDAGNIAIVDRTANMLAKISDDQLPKYKSVLSALECNDLTEAAVIREALDEYILTAELSSPSEAAIMELEFSMSSCMEELLPYVNLHGSGKALLESENVVMTDHGLVERKDGEPLQTMSDSQQVEGISMT